jgi:hypothetical protein
MLDAQIAHAQGLKYLVVRNSKTGKAVRVTEMMVKAKLGKDEEIIEVLGEGSQCSVRAGRRAGEELDGPASGCARSDNRASVHLPALIVTIVQRPEEHAPDDAEDRGVGANPQRQGQDDGGRQAFGPAERADRESEVSEQMHIYTSIQPTRFSTLEARRKPRAKNPSGFVYRPGIRSKMAGTSACI